MPFAGYEDFEACVAANSDKEDPEAYCATIMREAEKVEKATGSDSAMIALIPTEEDAQRLALSDGLPAEELHVTLRYLGLIDDLSGDQIVNSRKIVADAASRWRDGMLTKIIANVAGFGVLGNDSPRANVLFLNGWDLDLLYRITSLELDSFGLDMGHYRPWIPHMTLGYGINITDTQGNLLSADVGGGILFDRIRFALGDNNYDYFITP